MRARQQKAVTALATGWTLIPTFSQKEREKRARGAQGPGFGGVTGLYVTPSSWNRNA